MKFYNKIKNYLEIKLMRKTLPKWFLVVGMIIGILGIMDAGYLTYEHFQPSDVCPLHGGIINCQKVNASQYAVIWNIPVAVLGLAYYLGLSLIFFYLLFKNNRAEVLVLLLVLAIVSAVFSIWLLYVQLALIGYLCTYCIFSFLLSMVMLVLDIYLMHKYHVAHF